MNTTQFPLFILANTGAEGTGRECVEVELNKIVETGVEEVDGAVRLEGGVILTHWNDREEV